MLACRCSGAPKPGYVRTEQLVPTASGPSSIRVNRVAAARGLDWIVAGWVYVARIVRAALVLAAIVLAPTLLLVMLVSLRVGSVLFSGFIVFFLAIISSYCRKLDHGEPLPRLRDQAQLVRSYPLWIVAAIAAAATLALDFLSNTMGVYAQAASWSGLGLYFVFVKLLSLLLMMTLWLAPALIVLNGASPVQAMKLSLLGTLKNILPWCVFSVLAFVLCIVALIPLGLGMLIALPTLACAAYMAWRDQFV